MNRIFTVTLNPAFDLHYQMEHFEAEKENYVQGILCDAGGKGINISRALHVNGVESTAYVILGEENGGSFEAGLRRDGLTYTPFYTPGRIRENITLHPAGAKETRISLDTFSVKPALLQTVEVALLKEAQAGDLVAFAGRNPRGLEKATVIAFLKRLIAHGLRLVVDSNSFTPADLQELRPYLIKPNEQEIVSFLGTSVSSLPEAAEAARTLSQKGVAEQVMISLGGDGAVWSDGEAVKLLHIPRLEHPASTIGAGDSTLAGFLSGLSRALPLEDVLRTAVSFGTAACMTPGTLPPRPEDVAAVYEQVRVE